MKSRSAEQWLREAYIAAPGCPPPEAFLPDLLEEMDSADRRKLEEHAQRCPACAAERTLATEFDPPPGRLDAVADDVDHVVRRLRSPLRTAERSNHSQVIPPAVLPIRRRNVWTWSLAAAAMFAFVALGLIFTLESPAPPLPQRTGDGVLRGSLLEIVQPFGDLDALPLELEWESVSHAASYRVRLLRVDGKALFETETTDRSVRLPRGILSTMHAAVVYSWEAEALDGQGEIIARSERVEFKVKPKGFE